MDERKAEVRREEASKLKYVEEATQYAEKKNQKLYGDQPKVVKRVN
jgi:hypothetical protein